jgi:O-antigen/teichoic acid export membrane protein
MLATLSQKITFSSLVQYAGKIIQILLATISLKLVSGFLQQHDYGMYATITEYCLFLSAAANLGLFANIVRKMADKPRDSSIFINALLLRVFSAFILFVIGLLYLGMSGANEVLLIGSAIFLISLFLDYITSICDAVLQVHYRMGQAMVALILGRIVNVILIWYFIGHYSNGQAAIIPLLTITISGAFVTAITSLLLVIKKLDWHWHWNPQLMWQILCISIPFGLINVINNLYFRFLPDYFAHQVLTEAQFATFALSFRIMQVLALASTFVMFSALPALTAMIDEKKFDQAYQLYRKISRLLIGGGVVLVTLGSLLGPTALALVTHQKYVLADLWFVLPMMLFLAAISYGYDVTLITLFALGKEKWWLARETIVLIIALLLFSMSYFIANSFVNLCWIMSTAIIAELSIVLMGVRKVSHELKRR